MMLYVQEDSLLQVLRGLSMVLCLLHFVETQLRLHQLAWGYIEGCLSPLSVLHELRAFSLNGGDSLAPPCLICIQG